MRKWTLLTLAILLMSAWFIFCFSLLPNTTVTEWRKETGYKGDICFVAYDKQNKLHCSNGVAYTKGSVNAKEGYDIWKTCKELPTANVCNWD